MIEYDPTNGTIRMEWDDFKEFFSEREYRPELDAIDGGPVTMVTHDEELFGRVLELARIRGIPSRESNLSGEKPGIERALWAHRWPNYCRRCNGNGAFTDTYKVDFGPGSLDDAEPCPDCTAKGICARCGEQGLTEEGEGPCTHCGWDYDDGMPVDPDGGVPEAYRQDSRSGSDRSESGGVTWTNRP